MVFSMKANVTNEAPPLALSPILIPIDFSRACVEAIPTPSVERLLGIVCQSLFKSCSGLEAAGFR